MLFRALRLKRIWIPALVLIGLGIAGWAWASQGRRYVNPSELSYTAGRPSAASLHSAPYYGTKVRFEDSARTAFLRAEQENKLVLLLHLSGRFGSSEMT